MSRRWKELKSDEEFAALFANAHIVQATTALPGDLPPKYADVFWEFSDGSWLAMEVSAQDGCDTCGPEVEKTYHHLAAPQEKPDP